MAVNGTNKEVVCVTGGNGFIGSWLVRTLLGHGYKNIHVSIYPGTAYSHLLELPGADKAIIRVFEADLRDKTAISKAVEGCSGVFHVASPCSLESPKDPENELLAPAIQGTINVLEGVRSHGVRRVILTSSISSLVPNPNWQRSKVVDESSWTDLDYCKSRQKWYPVSKTLAERSAWEFAEKYGIDMVSILPSTCLGPLLQPGLNASSSVLQQLLLGSCDTPDHWLGAVHVKDVAKGQILLLETPSASGRYLCTNGIYQFSDFANRVSTLFPQFPIHRFRGETQPGLIACEDASKRLMSLGLTFTPLEDALREAVESLKAKRLLNCASDKPTPELNTN